MIALVVTARLAAGVAHTQPWGIALDGILASELWGDLKRTAPSPHPALDAEHPPDLDLPLARCVPAEGPWHWAATCAWPDPIPAVPSLHTWTGRVDHRALEHLTPSLPKVISNRQGRYRARCMPLLVTTCTTLTWHAIGDPHAIGDILQGVHAIGKKRSQGEGVVLAWSVQPAPSLDGFTAAHLTPAGGLGRPTPTGCLHGHPDLADTPIGYVGVRPPYMHHSRMHDVHLPARIFADS